MGGNHHSISSVQSLNATNTTDDGFVAVPLTDGQRTIVAVVHFLVFVVGAVSIWAFLYKLDTLRNRIWCPYFLLMGLVFFQIAGAFEIGNHYYEGDWELAGSPSDLINGSFYFFNFGATYLNALGLRNKDVPLFRRPLCGKGFKAGALDFLSMAFDLILVVGFVLTAPFYATAGREDSSGMLSAFAAIGGIATLFRLYYNLGPNCGTLFGGLGWWAMIIVGIVLTSVYKETGYEWLHAVLGSFFVFCLVPITVAILCASDVQKSDSDASNEDIQGKKNDLDEQGDIETSQDNDLKNLTASTSKNITNLDK